MLSDLKPSMRNKPWDASFKAHSIDGTVNRPITDLSAKKIASLPTEVIAQLNEVFAPQQQTLADWGYTLRTPGEPATK